MVRCNFAGVEVTEGSVVSATEVDCRLPQITETRSASIEVSPNGGNDWSATGLYFHFGADGCTAPCLGLTCANDPATGTCDCDDGLTGDACDVVLSLTSLTDDVGPTVGFQYVEASTNDDAFPIEGCRPEYLVRFTGSSAGEVATVTGTLDSPRVTFVTPTWAYGAGAVDVQLSPNNGKDWSTALTYTFVEVRTLCVRGLLMWAGVECHLGGLSVVCWCGGWVACSLPSLQGSPITPPPPPLVQPTALYEGLTTSVALTSDDMFFYLFHGDRFVDLNILVESSSGAVDVQVRCWKKGKGGRGCLLRGKSRVGEGGWVFGGAFFFLYLSVPLD